jgi:hypothetical protein
VAERMTACVRFENEPRALGETHAATSVVSTSHKPEAGCNLQKTTWDSQSGKTNPSFPNLIAPSIMLTKIQCARVSQPNGVCARSQHGLLGRDGGSRNNNWFANWYRLIKPLMVGIN